MNPADSESDPQVTSLCHTVSSQGALLGQHDQSLRGTMGALAAGFARVERQLQIPPPPTPGPDPLPAVPAL